MPSVIRLLPDAAAVVCELEGEAWRIDADWRVVDGRWEPVRISISAPQESNTDPGSIPHLTATLIRKLAIGNAIDELRRSDAPASSAQREWWGHASQANDLDNYLADGGGGAGGNRAARRELLASERAMKEVEAAMAAPVGSQRGRRLTNEDLQAVAAVYRSARAHGLGVTKAVADHFHVSRSTSGKRIMAARAAGMLEGIGPRQ